jgi:N-acetylglucosaminyldiphosphoundecaprenol N-acetyl-beta-D-mannosaminyltransferase
MPLIFAGKLKGLQLKKENRITSLDWLNTLMRHAVRNGWRIFFLGSKPEVVKKGVIILKEKFPGLQISAAHGYFDVDTDSEENKSITSLINNYNPNILMVGMGMPRQEYWTFDNSDSVSANVIINIGAIMDYVSGAIPTPPRWSGKLYLEWLFRLAAEPKRLFFRYIIEPILLIGILISKKIKKDKNHA